MKRKYRIVDDGQLSLGDDPMYRIDIRYWPFLRWHCLRYQFLSKIPETLNLLTAPKVHNFKIIQTTDWVK